MSKKSGKTYTTELCGRCGGRHSNYSGKLDINNIEYVICGGTNKRMNIDNGLNCNSFAFSTIWVEQNRIL